MNERIWNQRMLGLTFNVEDGRITIFRSTLEALGWPTHYRFLYNREAKQVAVQNCTAEDAGAHKTPKLTVSNSCEIKCVALVRMIYRDMRWNRNNTYRLEGKSVPRQQLVSFDLDIPFWWKTGKLWTKIQAPQSPCVAKNCPLRKVPRPRQLNATVGRCEGCVAKSAKGSQSGQNPGCLQGSKVEGDRVGRSYTDKSTQQVNKITFAPMNVKNK